MICYEEVVCNLQENFPVLSPGEIHIWQVFTDITSADFVKYKSVLSDTELTKAHFFKNNQARDSYVVRQAALRLLLSRYLSISLNSVKVGQEKKGKPISLDDPGLYFNISKSGTLATIAFSRDSELGIDIERVRPLTDLNEMISSNFTTNEIKFINSKPNERLRRFFRFWTVKESFLKAIGEGLSIAPKNVEFNIENEQIKQLSILGVSEQKNWNFKEFTTSIEYVGTITYEHNNLLIKQLKLN